MLVKMNAVSFEDQAGGSDSEIPTNPGGECSQDRPGVPASIRFIQSEAQTGSEYTS
jgi:hypothetical protein